VGVIVVMAVAAFIAFLFGKKRGRQDNEASMIEPANLDAEPKSEPLDLAYGRLRYIDGGPTLNAASEVPPTFNSG
jgi:hypothetical protein